MTLKSITGLISLLIRFRAREPLALQVEGNATLKKGSATGLHVVKFPLTVPKGLEVLFRLIDLAANK